jgi:hypothetical protein
MFAFCVVPFASHNRSNTLAGRPRERIDVNRLLAAAGDANKLRVFAWLGFACLFVFAFTPLQFDGS